ncbi:MAG: Fe-S cluster assembly protein SufD [Bacteroidales bacterium]
MNKETAIQDKIEQLLVKRFYENEQAINNGDPEFVAAIRRNAIKAFEKAGIPAHPMEDWRKTEIRPAMDADYKHDLQRNREKINIEEIFQCQVHNFETFLVSQLNGWYAYKDQPIREHENGVVVGSLREAFQQYPRLVKKHYGKYAKLDRHGMIPLNTAFAQDGVFIYVPDNVEVDLPIQMVNLTRSDDNILVFPRNMVVMGKNSKLTMVHCDDSIEQEKSFTNAVSEVFLDEHAHLDYYKVQNKDDEAALINAAFFYQSTGSVLSSNTISLNGGILRNETDVTLGGEQCHSDIIGLYLMDRKQHVDNRVFVDHASPNCYSNELFKGIIDDEASAVFNGHILVRKDSQETTAFQSNRNIQLTDTARIFTQPFLEIYADNVKCSHGATIGQLDPEAMFYLRSRGICKRNARMLMMYAFAGEVVKQIRIDALKERIDDMVVKRLKGELSICDQCVLHCKDERKVSFEIDIDKL